MLTADSNAMYVANDMMNQRHRACTIVHNESEVFYDSDVRLHGSMFTRNAPGNGSFNLYFPADHLFCGVCGKAGFRISGRGEIVVKHLINAAGGLPENYDDVAWMIGPGSPSGAVGNTAARLEVTQFDAGYFSDGAADGTQGTGFKMEGIREYQTTVDGTGESRKLPWPNIGWVFGFDIGNEGDNGTKPELYRHNIRFTSNRAQDDNSKIVAMCQAFSQPAGAAMDGAVNAAIDADEWMRCLALESLCGIGDAYGFPSGNPHNINFYAPPAAGKVVAVPWDWNFAFYNATNTPMLPSTHNISIVAARPIFARLFWGHVRDLCRTSFNGTTMAPWLSHYAAHTGDGYGSYSAYMDARCTYALSQLPATVPFAITTNGGAAVSTSGATLTIQGNGWIDVREIRVNGSPDGLAVTWIDDHTWRVTLAVAPGTNQYLLTAFDHQGAAIGTSAIVVTGMGVVVPASAGNLTVSEIMYNPATHPDDEFIEVQSIGAQTIDLTGCAFTTGIDYLFANGTTLTPGARMVILKAQFLNASALSNGGERIVLSGPGGGIIKDFKYGDSAPWPASADGLGRSLVLIAPRANPELNDPFNWRPSTTNGGNPGTSDALPAPANPLGDDDGDGWPNLLEYAAARPIVPATFDATGHLTLAFTRNLAADDAIYVVETSADLQTWNGGAAVERVSQANPIGGTTVETWRVVSPAIGNERQFMRLRATVRP